MTDADDPEAEIARLRDEIASIDEEIVSLIAERVRIARRIGELKAASSGPFLDDDQSEAVLDRARSYARGQDLDSTVIGTIFRLLIHLSLMHEMRDRDADE